MKTLRTRLRRTALVTAALPLLALLVTTGSASASPNANSHKADPRGGWILFERYIQRTPHGPLLKDLFLVRENGTDERRLMPAPVDPSANIVHADWSPDGTHIAFEVLGHGDGTPEASVWVVGADGRNPQKVAGCSDEPCRQYSYPDWSPDGRHLAMVRFDLYSDGSCCTSHLTVIDVARRHPDGLVAVGGERVVQSFTEADVDTTYDAYYSPRWSPDSRRLVYTVEQYDVADPYPLLGVRLAVVSVAPGRARPTFITPSSLRAGNADWSPTEDRIAFATYPLGTFQSTDQPSNIYTIRSDGRQLRRVTSTSTDGSYRLALPNWTPDGRQLLITVARAADGERVSEVSLGRVSGHGGDVIETPTQGSGWKLQPHRRACPAR